MLANPLLSIVIPTYNRADFLDYSLEVHTSLAKEHNIQIFVFDNASTDSTILVVEKWKKYYPLIQYHRHDVNIGPENNFEIALKHPDTHYIWLLGDTYQIPEKGISYILNLISSNSKQFDALVFNLCNIINSKQENYEDHNALLHDLGAVMTCLSCLVYSKNIIKDASFIRYSNTFYRHSGIIFEYISYRPCYVHWINDLSVEGLEKKGLEKKNWSHTQRAFEIGCEKWVNFVFSLPPSYTIESKMKCLMDFGEVSGLFTLKNIFWLRVHGIFNYNVFRTYKRLFILTIGYPYYFLMALSLTPIFILNFFMYFYRTIKKIKPRNIFFRIFSYEK